jgi:ribosomal protein S12 methylthiotransferase accessory factor
MPTVAIAGTGPAAEAAAAALADAEADVTTTADPADVAFPEVDLAVVVADTDSDALDRVNAATTDAAVPWLAVEVGGVGGAELTAASVVGFEPGAGCYTCLRARVAAAGEDPPRESPATPGYEVRLAGALAGREAVRALDGESVGGLLIEVPATRRRFHPVPDCPACGGERERALDRGADDAPLDAAVDRADRAVDARVGVVTEVGERSSFPAPYYLAALADTSGFSDAEAARHAAGVAVDWDRAYVKAVGEAIERYSAGVYRTASLPTGTAADVENAVTPGAFVRPDDAPDPDPEAERAWLPGEHLATGERVHLPAEFALFPPPEERLRPAITTGLGVGTSGAGALAAGLTEVVERDATMLAWYSTFEPLGLAVEAAEYDTLARRARSEGLSASAFLLTQDVDVPVVGATVHREEWPRFAAGSAAGLDAGRAATDALAEALQNWMELDAMGPEDAADAGGAVGRYADFPREVHELVDLPPAVAAADVGPAEPPSRGAALDALVERVADAGLDAYAARLTPRDVEAVGFEAVRVLVPAAQPLFVGDAYFGERARTVPTDLGFRPRLDRPFHPYP